MLALELSLVPRSNSCILSPTNFRNFKDHFFVHRNYRISQSSSVLKFGRKVQNSSLQVRAATGDVEELKWWQKNGGPNMHDIHSTQEFIDELSKAGEKLVIVEFYGTWCGSCRALFPKFCKLAAEHPDVIFLKVNFDENKSMCKSLNVKVLPYFHFYRGADGRVDSFSCSLAKGKCTRQIHTLGAYLSSPLQKSLQKLKDAIELHSSDRCSLGPPLGVGDIDFLQASNSNSNSNDKSTATGSSR